MRILPIAAMIAAIAVAPANAVTVVGATSIQITNALNEFEASLTSTEKDNINTDQAQSSNYSRVAGRLS